MRAVRGSLGVGALAATLVGALAAAAPGTAAADTLDEVRERGAVRCGLHPDLAGFSSADSLGRFSGFDVELCRAVAAAVLGDADAFEPLPLDAAEQFGSLGTGEVDLLSRNVGWTLLRDARFGEFAGTSFHDGQGFMVRRRDGLRSALELDDRRVCVERGTDAELDAADFFVTSGLRYRPVYFDDPAALFDGYARGECDAITTGRASLAARRSGFDEPAAHAILPELISKEPFGPVVRAGDERWEDVVRWSLNCMIDAEEHGLTSAEVPDRAEIEAAREDEAVSSGSATSAVARLLGLEGNTGGELALGATWCADIVRLVGNYGEVYARHIGPDTPLGLSRGINALWSDGGLIHSPPVR